MKSKMINTMRNDQSSIDDLLGGGRGGAVGIEALTLVGAPGGADEIDDVELFGEPKTNNDYVLRLSTCNNITSARFLMTSS